MATKRRKSAGDRNGAAGAGNGRGRKPGRAHLGRPTQAVLLMGVIVMLLAMVLAVLPRVAESAAPGGRQAPETPAPQPDVAPQAGTGPQQPSHPEAQREPQLPPESAVRTRAIGPLAAAHARVAVVIDDVGYNLRELEPFLQIPGPVTFAILPGLPHSAEAARRAAAAGKEVIVHMPMEPLGPEDPGPGAIMVSQSDSEIRERLERALQSVPEARGMNNHMGSRAEADRRVMGVVMDTLRARGLFFLDSRTTASTVAQELAAERDVPLLERSVFLDNVPEPVEVEARLREALAVAVDKGEAVLIGHVQNAATREVLARALPGLAAKGFERVALSALLP